MEQPIKKELSLGFSQREKCVFNLINKIYFSGSKKPPVAYITV